jgi:hypothetical protein
MVRLMVGLAAWTAGTAVAVGVAWLGANVVVRNAGVQPGMPVINAAVLPSAAAPSPAASPPAPPPGAVPPTAGAARAPSGSATTADGTHSPAAGPSPSSAASAGGVRAYTLAGGDVTLDVTGGAVQLVTAVPAAGYSVQTWSGTGWLRVDFSSGPRVSSLIASWYQHAPTITVTN